MSDSESESSKSSSSAKKTLWKHYSNLTKSPEFQSIYNRFPQPLTRKNHLKALITETEKVLGYSIPNAFQKFSQRENPNDPSDNVHLSDITFKAFIRRLSNVILESIYEEGKYDKTLKEFITDVRGEAEISSFGEQSSSDEEEKEEKEEKGEKEEKEEKEEKDEFEVEKPRNSSSQSSERSSKNEKNRSFEEEKPEENKKIKIVEDIKSPDSKKSPKKNNQTRKTMLKPADSPLKKLNYSQKSSDSEVLDQKPPLPKSISKAEKAGQKPPIRGSVNPKPNNSALNLKVQDSLSMKKDPNTSLPGLPTKSKKMSSSSSSEYEEKGSKLILSSLNAAQNHLVSNSQPDALSSFLLASLSENSKNSWFSSEIKGKESDFKSLFLTFNEGKEFLVPKVLPTAFENSLKKLKITPHEHHKGWFKSIHEALHPVKMIQNLGKKTKVVVPKISFVDFIEIMNLWGEKYLKEKGTVVGDLVKSIDNYSELNFQVKDNEKVTEEVQKMVLDLEKLLNTHLKFSKSTSELEDKLKKNLDDIFQFYAKVQRIQGTDDTFESMETNNTNLNLASFLKFCADFELILVKGEEKRGISKENLTVIFKRTANNTRLMSFPQFLDSLDKIAEVFYTPELDKALSTSFAYCSLAEKRDLLYKHMSLNEFSKYHLKKKNFGLAFSPEKYSRIPRDESSQKYKFKPSDEVLKKLEEWKKNKKQRETPQPLKPIKEAPPPKIVKNSSRVLKDPGRPFQTDVRASYKALQNSGYSQKSKIKKIEAKEEIEEAGKFEEKEQPVQEKVITIQGLSNMRYEELDEDQVLRDLVVDDEDEYFDKLYGIEPKLLGIMKLHDLKVAKGQKVVEKSKYRIN